MPPNGQAFVHQRTAARTDLRGERGRHGDNCLPSLCRFERQDAQESSPPSVRDGLCQVRALEHVGRLQVFMIDSVILPHQSARRLVVEVLAHPATRRTR
jgi:hypothetical protein